MKVKKFNKRHFKVLTPATWLQVKALTDAKVPDATIYKVMGRSPSTTKFVRESQSFDEYTVMRHAQTAKYKKDGSVPQTNGHTESTPEVREASNNQVVTILTEIRDILQHQVIF